MGRILYKRYKVTYTPTDGAAPVSVYKDTRKEAQELAKSYAGRAARVKVKPVEMERHHSATARGYIRKNSKYRESYAGRFGVGYIEHSPNMEVPISNNYHCITYYTEV